MFYEEEEEKLRAPLIYVFEDYRRSPYSMDTTIQFSRDRVFTFLEFSWSSNVGS